MVEFTLLAFSSLFVIVDPIAVVPAFLAMTPHDTPEQRVKMARLACIVMTIVLVAFAWVGKLVFKLLGITLPAFQLAGSVVLMLVALDMLRAQISPVRSTAAETDAGAAKDDIAITPLAVPMLAGPGAMTTSILLRNQADTVGKQVALLVVILLVAAATYVIFRLSAHGAKWLNPIVLRITTRIMGLLLAAVAVQFAFDALKAQKLSLP